jgi:hypothetical protein
MIFLCDGKKRGCHKRLELGFKSLEQIEGLARTRGWSLYGTRDLCPACDEVRQYRPECPNCAHWSEFSNDLGHDRLGHGASNALAAAGVRTWEQLEVLSGKELAAMPRLGGNRLALVLHVQSLRKQDKTC